VLAGLVERVTYQNAENGFCVIRVKARGHRDLVTVVGHAAVISAGEWITASGDWTTTVARGEKKGATGGRPIYAHASSPPSGVSRAFETLSQGSNYGSDLNGSICFFFGKQLPALRKGLRYEHLDPHAPPIVFVPIELLMSVWLEAGRGVEDMVRLAKNITTAPARFARQNV
jgi:hypothetical protein